MVATKYIQMAFVTTSPSAARQSKKVMEKNDCSIVVLAKEHHYLARLNREQTYTEKCRWQE